VSEGVIHVFEVVEIDPVKGKAASGLQRPEAAFKLLAEVMPIGNLGQRIMAGPTNRFSVRPDASPLCPLEYQPIRHRREAGC
jgi:hypothetical protein